MATASSATRVAATAVLAVTALLCAGATYAQEPSNGNGDHSAATTPTVEAAYRETEVRIDGQLDDAAWQNARPATRFVQGEPVENAPAEQDTEVRVLYDERALYVAARMYDRRPESIADQLVRRDGHGQYDYFEVSFDPNSDRRTGYRFRVSAAGVQRDVYMFDDVREDDAWDAVWQSAVHRDSTGWSTEIRIPLSQLKYNATDSVQTWGVNFSRRRISSNERTYFALESRVHHGKVSVFGRLQGLYFPKSARRLELRPYALVSGNRGPSEPGDPFFDGSATNGRVGLDMRLGLGAGYTLDATIDPDFGQVEVDPAVINLTQFEVFFPERRPFFVEDARIFDFRLSGRQNQLFYSRRIGREPRGESPDDADFEEIPSETTILAAAKLTGRTTGGLSLGALAAFTERETGHAYLNDPGTTVKFTVEPPAQYGVLRLAQDFRRGASQVGGIFTVTNRSLPSDGSFDDLPSKAYSLGIDFEHNFGGPSSRNWALHGFFTGTHVRGDSTAVIRLQRASNHYFQRPDADYLEVDSSATSLTGINWRLQFERRSARHWTGSVWLGQIAPGFEANDLGFLQSNERLDAGARVTYREISPGSLFRSYNITFFTFGNWRHSALDDPFSSASWGHAQKSGMATIRSNFEFLNYWELSLNARHSGEVFSDTHTRGGPLMIRPASTEIGGTIETDARKVLFLRPRLEYEELHRGGHRWQTGLGIGIRPSPSLEIQFSPQYSTGLDPAQYFTSEEDESYLPTYGGRYFFSDLNRHQFSFETRLNVAFNPWLTLQLFAQPLISSGHYLTFKQLDAAETFDFDVFEQGEAVEVGGEVTCVGGRTCTADDNRYIDWDGDGQVDLERSEPDFNIQSLRLNAVLRWEYRPGSTVYLVWQQNRRDRIDTGSFDLGRDLDLLRSIEPENVLIVKVNYWLGI